MIIKIDEINLTAVIVDNEETPTKICNLGNWNPEQLRKWQSHEELSEYAEIISRNEKFFTEYKEESSDLV